MIKKYITQSIVSFYNSLSIFMIHLKPLLPIFANMEMSELDSKWITVKAMLQDRFGKVPDMEGIIFLIGINEVGFDVNHQFKKEEKQDLMHVATCTLMSFDGYYQYLNHDEDGWPHFKKIKEFPAVDTITQETYLKEKIVEYFEI